MKKKEEKKTKQRKTKQTCAQGAGRVPRTRLLLAGTIRIMISPVRGPTTLGRHNWTRQKARKKEED